MVRGLAEGGPCRWGAVRLKLSFSLEVCSQASEEQYLTCPPPVWLVFGTKSPLEEHIALDD